MESISHAQNRSLRTVEFTERPKSVLKETMTMFRQTMCPQTKSLGRSIPRTMCPLDNAAPQDIASLGHGVPDRCVRTLDRINVHLKIRKHCSGIQHPVNDKVHKKTTIGVKLPCRTVNYKYAEFQQVDPKYIHTSIVKAKSNLTQPAVKCI